MDDKVRLIDAEALKNYMCSTCPNKERCEDTEQVCSAILDVDEQPTIEAQPVKHGRWEHGECSVCGASPLDHVSGDMYVEVDYYPNYCPSCGSQNADLWVDDESVPNEDMRPDNEVM